VVVSSRAGGPIAGAAQARFRYFTDSIPFMIAQSPFTVNSTFLFAIIWDRQVKSGHFIGVQPSEPTTAGYIRRLYASSIMNTEV
jgi:hypothetical protein